MSSYNLAPQFNQVGQHSLKTNEMKDLQFHQMQFQQQHQEQMLSITNSNLQSENHWFKEKLKEIAIERDQLKIERDRLMCEVANLRLEIDMAELKRLPDEHNFPQRLDRSSPGHSYAPYSLNYQINPLSGNDSNHGTSSNYSYIQQPQLMYSSQNYAPHRAYPSGPTLYHHHHPQNNSTPISSHHQKKLSHRNNSNSHSNGDISKRTHSYELSQDLLDKQVELLERKYGGIRARKAALVIQRAFRRYMMDKKFATITANAKSDKRSSYAYSTRMSQSQSLDIGAIDAPDAPNSKISPSRSMSLREQRSPGGTPQKSHHVVSTVGLTKPSPHPYVNVLHQQQSPQYYYSPQQMYHLQYQNSYQTAQDMSGNSGLMDSSLNGSALNLSWGASPPQVTHFTAAQIYMRPKHGLNSSNPNLSLQLQHQQMKRPPPDVPKRTSSIISHSRLGRNGLNKGDNGSLCSVQSSGSDSSSIEKMQCDLSDRCSSSSPQWKRKEAEDFSHETAHDKQTSASPTGKPAASFKLSETIRKRQYRVGLNLFNKKPEKGVAYLVKKGFLENTPHGVAKFLISRKGLSRQMIGEYLGNLQQEFNMAVLAHFVNELDLSGMQVDVALRKFQGYFRMPGEAQKIERLVEVFSQRYASCNTDIISRLRSSDTIFVLAFAIIMLNTDLHTPNMKPERRMTCDDFVKNLRGVDDCGDVDREMLLGIYDRIKTNEFKAGSDHVSQVMKVQATINGKKPNLALPHRRLVCYCRLYEIADVNKKERPGVHQREVFLFNDLLVVTKIFTKKKSSVTYAFRNSFSLCGMVVSLLDVPNYPYCIRLSQKVDNKVLVTFNARNEHDRVKFAEDLQESIYEMDEMEQLRIESEMDRHKPSRAKHNNSASSTNIEHRDSGLADEEYQPASCSPSDFNTAANPELKRNTLSNSLLDMHEQFGNEKPQRRSSIGSLDSGMSVSFQSTSASTGSRTCEQNKLRIMLQQQNSNQHYHNSNQQAVIVQKSPNASILGHQRKTAQGVTSSVSNKSLNNSRSTEV